jgi:mono/diheme cytochrome c family protein
VENQSQRFLVLMIEYSSPDRRAGGCKRFTSRYGEFMLLKMRRFFRFAPLLAATVQAAQPAPTFYKDVLPILQKNCQSCHRPGEAAPMSLLTYEEARPWAAALRTAVLTKRMPPWNADPAYGHFRNDKSLSAKDVQTISDWATAKAPSGDPQDAPPPLHFVDGWNIGKPDMVVEMPKPYDIPATGTIEYTYYVVPSGFTEDKWITAAEIRPEARALIHHVIVFVREPGSKWLKEAKPGEAYVPPLVKDEKTGREQRDTRGQGEFLAGYAPGLPPLTLEPGQAKLVKAGSDLVFQMHYTAKGMAARDQTKVGFVFAKEPPRERVLTVADANEGFVIPPGASDYPVESKLTFYGDARIISYGPHMHVRGKSFRFDLVTPSGSRETLLNVPHYDFNWQHWYEPAEPLKVSSGTTIECFATFDNSPNNKYNPDPTSEVRWGDQTWQEMMIGFMDIAFDAKKSPRDIFSKPKTTPTPVQSASIQR